MDQVDPRGELAKLAEERGDDLSSLSRLIGRNAAYIQQFIKRGTPKRLAEDDRRVLARYFGVDEVRLGGGVVEADRTIPVRRFAVGASAGPGALTDIERAGAELRFEPGFLRALGAGPADTLSLIRVAGDSMEPTLSDGDEILVDRGAAASRLRDGVYVLRLDDALMVKRLARHPATGRIDIRSDNPAYPSWSDCDPAGVTVIGRVIWRGGRL